MALATPGSTTHYVGTWSLTTAGTSASLPVTIEPAPGVSDPTLDGNNGSSSGCQTATCDVQVLFIGPGVYADVEGVAVVDAEYSGVVNEGTLTVSGSTFSADAGYTSGAIANLGTLTVSGSTFQDGLATSSGGAIYNAGSLTVSTSTFRGNSSYSNGGAIFNNYNGTGTVSATTFVGNEAADAGGGAIFNAGTLTVSTSTFLANRAQFGGGAISNGPLGSTTGTLTVSASTFSGDAASDDTSDAIYNPGGGTVGAAADIFDEPCDQGGNWDDEGYNVGSDGTCLNNGTDDVDNHGSLTSLLGPLAPNGGPTETMLPLTGNPAVGIVPSGTTVTLGGNQVNLCPTTDQRGEETISGQACNAGAVQSGLLYAEYPVTSGSSPDVIVSGLNGNLWFTEQNGDNIGEVTPSGHVTEYPVPTSGSGPGGIAVDAQGDVWFTEVQADQIGELVPSEATTTLPDPGITEYPVNGGSYPTEIAEGPDGNMWFTEFGSANIGMITPSGQVTLYPVPGGDNPDGITEGPDGNMWFTDWGADAVGKITPSGGVTLYPLPTQNAQPEMITAGPDGDLWFTEQGADQIGKIDPLTATQAQPGITEFAVPTQGSNLGGITQGPDGNIWFTEQNGNNIGELDPATATPADPGITEYPVSTANASPTASPPARMAISGSPSTTGATSPSSWSRPAALTTRWWQTSRGPRSTGPRPPLIHTPTMPPKLPGAPACRAA